MSSKLPNITTVQKILENIETEDGKLNKKQVESLLKLKLGKEQMITLRDRDFILEVSGMINRFGFDTTLIYLKNSNKVQNREMIIKSSPAFQGARRRQFLEITKDLREKKITSYMKCPKCGQNTVSSISQQVRSGDEGMTDFHECWSCGFNWKN